LPPQIIAQLVDLALDRDDLPMDLDALAAWFPGWASSRSLRG
jgi:hypothetical protein